MTRTSIRKDFFSFIKKPDIVRFNNLNTKGKIIILFKVLLLTYLGLMITNVPISILTNLGIIGKIGMKVDQSFQFITEDYKSYKPFFYFLILVYVPIYEESSYRLFLDNFSIKYFKISVSLIIGFILEKTFINTLIWNPELHFLRIIPMLFNILVCSIPIYLTISFFDKRILSIKNLWNKNFGVLFYLSGVIFALAHYGNLNVEEEDMWILPLLFIQFVVYAISLGYIRIRLGIVYSIFLHSLFLGIRFGLMDLSIALKANTL